MRVDAHTHLADGLLAMLDEHGIDHAVCFPGARELAGSPKQIALANEAVARAAETRRIVGFGTVNPWHAEEAWAELERFASLGLRGLKLHPPVQGFVLGNRAVMDPIMERCRGLPVVIHAGLRVGGLPHVSVDLGDVRTLAQSYPDVTLVVAHSGWGGRDFRGATDLAQHCPNVWFDTSGVNIPNQLKLLAEAGAAERIMYGSDWPFLHPTVESLRVALAEVSPEVEANIRGGNAARLLGLEA